ncbi:triggering receptor expressed on myeloid cells 1 [Perognathus longimembris pacificus]|uniref:triggering receptor expressed on myeloid cells 1 n=1 Tax=Perognathus longimembris pacificus TaxID=214514 RepID=UPI002018B820|nr:triggering receptor expressed on myeloid cells 1 [Perognathus longimembris pacificus]
MGKARAWGLLWLLLVSGLRAEAESDVYMYFRTEGEDLRVGCPANIMIYADSQKAWQRLRAGGEVQTLGVTERPTGVPSEVRVGRTILRDDPEQGIFTVQMTDLRVEDSGLYRCVIYRPPASPIPLSHLVRLQVTRDPSVTPASSKTLQAQSATVSPPRDLSTISTRHGAVTQPLPKSPVVISSPGPGVNFTDMTTGIRIPVLTFVILAACGLLSKSLVSTVLFVVTRRSSGS